MTARFEEQAEEKVRSSSVVTDQLGVASAVIGRMFAESRFRIDGHDPAGFEFRLITATAGPLTCGRQRWGFQGRAESEPLNSFSAVVVEAGTLSLARSGRPDVVLGAGGVWLNDTAEPTRPTWVRDSTFGSVDLPLSRIAEAAAEVTGAETTAVRFLDNVPVDPRLERYWAHLSRAAYREAVGPDSLLASPLVRAHWIRTLASAALQVFPNTTMRIDYLPEAGHVGPMTLRRAVAHIHAHAAEPLTLAEIAAAAGIGPRALQQAFVRHLGLSPVSYLRQVRLEHAHRDLRAGDPTSGDTVGAIAARWGFAHASRFAAAYRERYAVPPGVTLRS